MHRAPHCNNLSPEHWPNTDLPKDTMQFSFLGWIRKKSQRSEKMNRIMSWGQGKITNLHPLNDLVWLWASEGSFHGAGSYGEDLPSCVARTPEKIFSLLSFQYGSELFLKGLVRAPANAKGNRRRPRKYYSKFLTEEWKAWKPSSMQDAWDLDLAALQGSGMSQAFWDTMFITGGLQDLNPRHEPWNLT